MARDATSAGPVSSPDIRLSADSDQVVSLAQQPMNIARAYFSGKVKIEASMKDIFRLRRLL